jgi:hypothetical protein
MNLKLAEVVAMKSVLFAVVLAVSTGALAQNVIPPGTVLPVMLNSSLRSKKSTPGQVITARIMQNVPLTTGATIRAGSKLIGRVVAVTPPDTGTGVRISFRFDTLVLAGRTIPITTHLRALASMMEVFEAQVPTFSGGEGIPPTTVLVGGDVVYWGGGPVTNSGSEVVGEPVHGGVLSRVTSNRRRGCAAALTGNDSPQALWVFSSEACGIYGLSHIELADGELTNSTGEITLVSNQGGLNIQSGSGMLLIVDRRKQ